MGLLKWFFSKDKEDQSNSITHQVLNETCRECSKTFDASWGHPRVCKECWDEDSKQRSLHSRLLVDTKLESLEAKHPVKTIHRRKASGSKKQRVKKRVKVESKSPSSQRSEVLASDLTHTEAEFLRQHDISIEDVLYAEGMSAVDCKVKMKELDKNVSLARFHCKKAKHRLRNRSDQCIQCRPENLTFNKRYSESCYVYVAGSLSKKLMKVGSSVDPSERKRQLNARKYGGASDWDMLYSFYCKDAGFVENEAQKKLKQYQVYATYTDNNKSIESREIFSSSYIAAFKAVRETVRENNVSYKDKQINPNKSKYSFRSRIMK